jgi:hypothetical protein
LNGKRGAPAWWRGLAPASPYPTPSKRAMDATRWRQALSGNLFTINDCSRNIYPRCRLADHVNSSHF